MKSGKHIFLTGLFFNYLITTAFLNVASADDGPVYDLPTGHSSESSNDNDNAPAPNNDIRLTPAPPPPEQPQAAAPAPPPAVESPKWYVAKNAQVTGPYTESQMHAMIANAEIVAQTDVQKSGSQKWVKAQTEFPELQTKQTDVVEVQDGSTNQNWIQTDPPPTNESDNDRKIVLGAHLLMGAAGAAVDDGSYPDYVERNEGISINSDYKARFAGGIGFFVNLYLSKRFAFNTGIDFIGKGVKNDQNVYYGSTGERMTISGKYSLKYLEFPLGILFDINNLHLGINFIPNIALSGKAEIESAGETSSVNWGDSEWKNHRRFNISLRFMAGYAIPVGPISIVPALLWEFELLNSSIGDSYNTFDMSTRQFNLMLSLGVTYSL